MPLPNEMKFLVPLLDKQVLTLSQPEASATAVTDKDSETRNLGTWLEHLAGLLLLRWLVPAKHCQYSAGK